MDFRTFATTVAESLSLRPGAPDSGVARAVESLASALRREDAVEAAASAAELVSLCVRLGAARAREAETPRDRQAARRTRRRRARRETFEVYFARTLLTLGLLDRKTLRLELAAYRSSGSTDGFERHLAAQGVLDASTSDRIALAVERWLGERRRAARPVEPPTIEAPALEPPPVEARLLEASDVVFEASDVVPAEIAPEATTAETPLDAPALATLAPIETPAPEPVVLDLVLPEASPAAKPITTARRLRKTLRERRVAKVDEKESDDELDARLERPSDVGTNLPDVGPGPAPELDRQWRILELALHDQLAKLVGKTLGRTRLMRLLQSGDVVSTFEGCTGDDERTTLVKVLRPDREDKPLSRRRFTREAEALGKVDHPSVARVLDHGVESGVRYLVLDAGSGEPLSKRLEWDERLEQALAVQLGRGIALGLASLHEAGFVHRDVRPANVFVERDGSVKLVGLGTVHTTEALPHLTQEGHFVGHACYAAPELGAGGEVGDKADVYSLGVILFRLIAGRLPFEAKSVVELVAQHLGKTPPALGELVPGCPPRLAEVIERTLAKDPAARPSARELAALLAVPDLLEPPAPGERAPPPIPEPVCLSCLERTGVTSLHGRPICEVCLHAVELLERCADCGAPVPSVTAAGVTVHAGRVYCPDCKHDVARRPVTRRIRRRKTGSGRWARRRSG